TFERLGPRVPAIVVSPLIPRNLIEHRIFDHTAIPATLRSVFGIRSVGGRNGITGGVDHLITASRRTDAPMTLPDAVATAKLSVPGRRQTAVRRPAALLSD